MIDKTIQSMIINQIPPVATLIREIQLDATILGLAAKLDAPGPLPPDEWRELLADMLLVNVGFHFAAILGGFDAKKTRQNIEARLKLLQDNTDLSPEVAESMLRRLDIVESAVDAIETAFDKVEQDTPAEKQETNG